MNVAAVALSFVLLPMTVFGATAVAEPAASACVPQTAPGRTKITYPSGRSIVADVVDTPASREKGLMCVTRLPRDYGMLFTFPQEMSLNFWMKNTLVSLDIVWIGADKKITVIHDHMKKSTVETPDDKVAVAGGTGQYVLELPAGAAKRRGLKAGDQLRFDVPIPDR